MAEGRSFGPKLIGALLLVPFTTVTVGAGVVLTTIQARIPQISQRFKIRRAAAVTGTLGSGGDHSVRVDVGATVGVIPATVIAAAETVVTADAGSPETIFAGGSLITLLAATPATTGSLGNLAVVVEFELVENDVSRNYGGTPRQYQ